MMMSRTRTQCATDGSGEHWACQLCEFQFNMEHNITCVACDQPDPGSSRSSRALDQTRRPAGVPGGGSPPPTATRIVPVEWTEVLCEDDLPAGVEIDRDTETFARLTREMSGVGNVTSILRCEDYDLWESFVREKKKIVKKLNRGDHFTGWNIGPHCYHSGAGKELTAYDGSAHLHERLLFHTANASVATIFEEGFDTRLSSAGNFGRGIYFSDNPKKCDRYWKGGAGPRVMFVVQVVLGDAKIYPRGQNDPRLTREPERNPECRARNDRRSSSDR